MILTCFFNKALKVVKIKKVKKYSAINQNKKSKKYSAINDNIAYFSSTFVYFRAKTRKPYSRFCVSCILCPILFKRKSKITTIAVCLNCGVRFM